MAAWVLEGALSKVVSFGNSVRFTEAPWEIIRSEPPDARAEPASLELLSCLPSAFLIGWEASVGQKVGGRKSLWTDHNRSDSCLEPFCIICLVQIVGYLSVNQ